ncbi:RluA family pseudouridine synthase [Telmatocola sphagniphila]|uniref:RluA family pseudouridine synthase n=1 Tax=Telmatocola sphagniphila TaxID=1123043 RepID=A0A8E6B6Q6_9BACT|nr:RluA family pseudouridine synthase [Telmatocola sphagniphila]QVL32181.1 RluA family pseudouridine synthase [Telmatocola sphagniphila]
MQFAGLLEIVYEDNHLIAVNKPAGWSSAHFDGENDSLDQLVKLHLKEKYGKPGNVFLGVVHRLDKPVTGVLLFARTSKAAARLSEQFRENTIVKKYWAVAEVETGQKTSLSTELVGTLEDWLFHDDAKKLVRVVEKEIPGAKLSRLHYFQKALYQEKIFFELEPQSGRKHQLRVQLASRGSPIIGDRKYGSRFTFGDGIALHARELTFIHPIRHEPITLRAELPKIWRSSFAHLLQEAKLL